MKFESDVVIGLEIHVSLNTDSKLFCSCDNCKSEIPNSNVCPVCLGHPGSRPLMNKKALEYALKLAMALDFTIVDRLVFSRKTYFYPDLAKNFQITQYEEPLGSDGKIVVEGKEIGLERIHIEEDPGALIHKGDFVLIDYNRSGVPLCEIVTKPDITSAKEAREFVKKLIVMLNYLEIFDEEEGIVKADLNVSVRESDYRRVEIKGVSGLKDIENSLEYEILRQQKNPSEVVMETRGYDPENRITVSQRLKESEEDYGYIYEPDLVPVDVDRALVDKLKEEMPTLVDERIKNYVSSGMKQQDEEIITSIKEVSDLFDMSQKRGIDFSFATNFFRRDVISRINYGLLTKYDLVDGGTCEQLLKLAELLSFRKINYLSAKEIFEKLSEDKKLDVESYAKDNNLFVAKIDLDSVCREVISENEKPVEDYKAGKENALNYLVGQVMKKVKGQAMPDDIKSRIIKII